MKWSKKNDQTSMLRDMSSQEYRGFILPTSLAELLVLLAFLLNLRFLNELAPSIKEILSLTIAASAAYITMAGFYLIPARKNKDQLIWLNAFLSGAGLWLLGILTPTSLHLYFNLLLLLGVIAVAVLSGRMPTLLMIAIGSIFHTWKDIPQTHTFLGWVEAVGFPLFAILTNETVARVQYLSNKQIRRLEIINTFSRQVTSTLEREEIIAHLTRIIPNALTADSYYVSVLEGNELHFLLCFDEGEFFNGLRIPAEGTFTYWVIQHQRELFLPDLRRSLELDGVHMVLAGKEKTSLSWIGVPMNGEQFKGVLALASYQPNAFNRGDLELLFNLAHIVSLALDNAAHHAEVEQRSKLDSLTGVYNHGAFLALLEEQGNQALASQSPLCLIMLDVDWFKNYNDRYGHLVGDQILIALCHAIRMNVKTTDIIGRWGGEEFCILLPNTTPEHALIVATRIAQKMQEMTTKDRDNQDIPAPTISQGIASLPADAPDVNRLIDLADQRLYVAKNRGRNQIEFPQPGQNASR